MILFCCYYYSPSMVDGVREEHTNFVDCSFDTERKREGEGEEELTGLR
jgi:hypothetical protein